MQICHNGQGACPALFSGVIMDIKESIDSKIGIINVMKKMANADCIGHCVDCPYDSKEGAGCLSLAATAFLNELGIYWDMEGGNDESN